MVMTHGLQKFNNNRKTAINFSPPRVLSQRGTRPCGAKRRAVTTTNNFMQVSILLKITEFEGYSVEKAYASEEKARREVEERNRLEPEGSEHSWDYILMEVET